MHHPTDRIIHTTAFVTPVVEHWLECKLRGTGIATWMIVTDDHIIRVVFCLYYICSILLIFIFYSFILTFIHLFILILFLLTN